MKKEKHYLETTIWNFIHSTQSKEMRDITLSYMAMVRDGIYKAGISTHVIMEINRTKDTSRRDILLHEIEQYSIDIDEETVVLAEKYVAEGIIPGKYMDDAIHLAAATINDMDVIITWNQEHMVKHKTRMMLNGVNQMLGYGLIDICTPQEVIEND